MLFCGANTHRKLRFNRPEPDRAISKLQYIVGQRGLQMGLRWQVVACGGRKPPAAAHPSARCESLSVGLTAAKIKRDEEVERRLSEIESSLVHEADLDERDGGEVLPFALRSRGVGGGVPTVEGITAVIRITAVILIMDTAIPTTVVAAGGVRASGSGLGSAGKT
jgi:hypothetical protein